LAQAIHAPLKPTRDEISGRVTFTRRLFAMGDSIMTKASHHDERTKISIVTPRPSAANGLKALRAVLFLPITLLLSACGSDLACDSADVLQTAKELVIQRIHNSGFNESFDVAISNIRTQDDSSKQLLCKANAEVTNSKTLAAMGVATFTYDVDYQVERTTNGNLYVTVYPLHMR
jgi:hypothetical protein